MNLLKQSIAVVLLTATSAAAFATTPTVPTQPSTPTAGPALSNGGDGNGALFVAVWDPVTSVSLVQYLGLGYNDVGIPAMSDSDYLEFGTLATFGTTFSAAIGASATSRLQYMVISVDGNTLDGIAGAGVRATGAPNFATAVLTADPIGFANSNQGSMNTWTTTWNGTNDAGTQCLRINPCVYTGGDVNSPKFFGGIQAGSDFGGSIPATTSYAGAVGTGLSFYETTVSLAPGGEVDLGPYLTTSIMAGGGNQWLLSASGVLTYGNPIPLPAAAWLLLSGLAGLGVVGRRREAA